MSCHRRGEPGQRLPGVPPARRSHPFSLCRSACSACPWPGGAGLLSALTLKERVARAALAKCSGRRRATRHNGCLRLSAPALPLGARQGLMRLCLALRGAGSLWSWQLAGFISASFHFPCFSFPSFVFLALPGVQGSLQPPSICGIPGHPWCPPASSAAGQGEQGERDSIL